MPNLFCWIIVAALAAVEAAIVATALRMRVRLDPARGVLGARGAEVLWTILPILLLAAVVVLSFNVVGHG